MFHSLTESHRPCFLGVAKECSEGDEDGICGLILRCGCGGSVEQLGECLLPPCVFNDEIHRFFSDELACLCACLCVARRQVARRQMRFLDMSSILNCLAEDIQKLSYILVVTASNRFGKLQR